MAELRSLSPKLTPPSTDSVIDRSRLHQQIDQHHTAAMVWLAGPPGAGKTTLISRYLETGPHSHIWYRLDSGDADPATFFHYLSLAVSHAAPGDPTLLPTLTPDRLPGLDVFTLRYFEQLCARITSPLVLVFDNYQDVPGDALLHGIMAHAAAGLRAGVRFMVASRDHPPPAFARLHAHGALAVIDGESLKLTREETGALAGRRGYGKVDGQALDHLHGQTRGWAAGTVLLLEQTGPNNSSLARFDPQPGYRVFDYFAGEVLQQAPASDRMILLKTSLLTQVTASQAEALSAEAGAPRLLASLARKNYFTYCLGGPEVSYQYHPLFRDFLCNQLALQLSAPELAALRGQAARLAESAGQVDEAAALWREGKDWPALSALILRNAAALIDQGRNQTLRAWIEAMPADALATQPWLIFWRGVCVLPYDPEAARALLEQAYAVFNTQGDRVARLSAIGAIVDTYIFQWGNVHGLDRWINELEATLADASVLAQAPPLPAALQALVASTMFIALANRRPGHPQMSLWVARAWDIAVTEPGSLLSLRTSPLLLLYLTWWLGDLNRAGLLLDILRTHMQRADVPPLLRTAWCAMLSAYQWMSASNDECLVTAAEGIFIGEQTGVHIWDVLALSQGAFASLSSGRLNKAERDLESIAGKLTAGRFLDWATYYYNCAWLHFAKSDLDKALQLIEMAVQKAVEAGAPFQLAILQNEKARVIFYRGDAGRACDILKQVRAAGRAMGSTTVQYLSWLVEAEAGYRSADEAACVAALREGLAIGRAQNFQNHAWWSSSMMAQLYAVALEHDIETDYVCRIIKRRALSAPDHARLQHWPWPIKLYTLGAFAIEINGALLRFEGKAQKKPLELLMAIVSLGASDVTQTRLSDALWPDAQADAAQAAFTTVLHRLRKLLGDDEAVLLSNSRVSLNPHKVWLDFHAVEQSLMRVEHSENSSSKPPDFRVDPDASHALHLYQGPFLDGHDDAWMLGTRARLRTQFLRHAAQMSQRLIASGHHQSALDWLDKGISAEPLAESLYRARMQCQAAMGQRAEAIATYRHFRDMLVAMLGVEPAPETQAMYHALVPTSAAVQ